MTTATKPPNSHPTPDRDVRVLMSDGVEMSVDVFLPDGDGPFPVLLAVSPYQKSLRWVPSHPLYPWRETGPIEWYLDHGYAYVWADVRGTGASDGTWGLLDEREQRDLYELVEWCGTEAFSTGRVGMIGQSYYGSVQWMAASQRPPHLSCIAPYDAFVDTYRGAFYHGGIYSIGFTGAWDTAVSMTHRETGRLPSEPPRMIDSLTGPVMSHPLDDEWHRERSSYWKLDRIEVPTFSIGNLGKFALHLRGNVLGYEVISAPKKLLLTHAMSVAEAQELFDDENFHAEVLLPWYDHHLKGVDNGVMNQPPVQIWIRGLETYSDEPAWPIPDTTWTDHFLEPTTTDVEPHSLNNGTLTTVAPTIDHPGTTLTYPHPSWKMGTTALDSNGRPDPFAGAITYTSAPLDNDFDIIGTPWLTLFASSDQTDLDIIAKLHHITPTGEATRITLGWLKASHRALDPDHTTPRRPFHTHNDPTPITPHTVTELAVELMPCSHHIPAGHRLRLELSNGDSPLTDGLFWHYYAPKVGTDTYHHTPTHPSRLHLPHTPPHHNAEVNS